MDLYPDNTLSTMPIPTRSQSVRTAAASKPPPQGSDASLTITDATLASKVDSSKALACSSTTLPLPSRGLPTATHTLSSSSTTTGLSRPRLQPATGTATGPRSTDHSSASSTSTRGHQRPLSTVSLETQSRTRSTTTITQPKDRSAEQGVSSSTAAEKRSLPRPTFNTYQQHFSPRKPKPLLRAQSSRLVGSRDENHAQTQHFSRNQDELLQLSLVHRNSIKTLKEYETDIEEKLELMNRKVQKNGEMVRTLESEHQTRINAVALSDWLHNAGSISKEGYIENLGFCTEELAQISHEGREFDQLMSEFERWLAKVQKIMRMTEDSSSNLENDDDIALIDTPGPTWSHNIRQCTERLQLYRRGLQRLGNARSDSGLGFLLARHQLLADKMLEKLRIAKDIVVAVIGHQQAWMSSTLDAALKATSLDGGHHLRKGTWASAGYE
jgi:hypothetical protein